MPDWLVQVIIQYPIVTVVGFVAWYANREMKQQAEQFLRGKTRTARRPRGRDKN